MLQNPRYFVFAGKCFDRTPELGATHVAAVPLHTTLLSGFSGRELLLGGAIAAGAVVAGAYIWSGRHKFGRGVQPQVGTKKPVAPPPIPTLRGGATRDDPLLRLFPRKQGSSEEFVVNNPMVHKSDEFAVDNPMLQASEEEFTFENPMLRGRRGVAGVVANDDAYEDPILRLSPPKHAAGDIPENAVQENPMLRNDAGEPSQIGLRAKLQALSAAIQNHDTGQDSAPKEADPPAPMPCNDQLPNALATARLASAQAMGCTVNSAAQAFRAHVRYAGQQKLEQLSCAANELVSKTSDDEANGAGTWQVQWDLQQVQSISSELEEHLRSSDDPDADAALRAVRRAAAELCSHGRRCLIRARSTEVRKGAEQLERAMHGFEALQQLRRIMHATHELEFPGEVAPSITTLEQSFHELSDAAQRLSATWSAQRLSSSAAPESTTTAVAALEQVRASIVALARQLDEARACAELERIDAGVAVLTHAIRGHQARRKLRAVRAASRVLAKRLVDMPTAAGSPRRYSDASVDSPSRFGSARKRLSLTRLGSRDACTPPPPPPPLPPPLRSLVRRGSLVEGERFEGDGGGSGALIAEMRRLGCVLQQEVRAEEALADAYLTANAQRKLVWASLREMSAAVSSLGLLELHRGGAEGSEADAQDPCGRASTSAGAVDEVRALLVAVFELITHLGGSTTLDDEGSSSAVATGAPPAETAEGPHGDSCLEHVELLLDANFAHQVCAANDESAPVLRRVLQGSGAVDPMLASAIQEHVRAIVEQTVPNCRAGIIIGTEIGKPAMARGNVASSDTIVSYQMGSGPDGASCWRQTTFVRASLSPSEQEAVLGALRSTDLSSATAVAAIKRRTRRRSSLGAGSSTPLRNSAGMASSGDALEVLDDGSSVVLTCAALLSNPSFACRISGVHASTRAALAGAQLPPPAEGSSATLAERQDALLREARAVLRRLAQGGDVGGGCTAKGGGGDSDSDLRVGIGVGAQEGGTAWTCAEAEDDVIVFFQCERCAPEDCAVETAANDTGAEAAHAKQLTFVRKTAAAGGAAKALSAAQRDRVFRRLFMADIGSASTVRDEDGGRARRSSRLHRTYSAAYRAVHGRVNKEVALMVEQRALLHRPLHSELPPPPAVGAPSPLEGKGQEERVARSRRMSEETTMVVEPREQERRRRASVHAFVEEHAQFVPHGSSWFLAERKLFLWGLYHHFGVVGDPTHAVAFTASKWRALLSRAGCLCAAKDIGARARRRDSVISSEEVDEFFYKTRALSFDEFCAACVSVATRMYPSVRNVDEAFSRFMSKHLLPVAESEGARLLHARGEHHASVIALHHATAGSAPGSPGMLRRGDDSALSELFRLNQSQLESIFNRYSSSGDEIDLDAFILFCKDFGLLPGGGGRSGAMNFATAEGLFSRATAATDDATASLDYTQFCDCLVKMADEIISYKRRLAERASELFSYMEQQGSVKKKFLKLQVGGGFAA